ncbi:MAG TPA: adenine deaminase [Tepidisphaeraceae bacterium]|jgi:adenine deaminase
MNDRISANIVDVLNRRIFPGTIYWKDKTIERIEPDDAKYDTYVMPGFVDAHVHIESSMLVPSEFSRLASGHGTVATVSDPHEIANVMGIEGIKYMIGDALRSAVKIHFGAPPCVPATQFETSGAKLGVEEVAQLCAMDQIKYLSEVMNFPGVIGRDSDMLGKIAAAKRWAKRVDGHAPGLRGEMARKYFAAGIETDHECFTIEEAREKASLGVKILIREGSAARNFEALWPLLKERPDACMFCTDDMHPDALEVGHINQLVARAVANGVVTMHALQCACINPVQHYGLNVGLLRPGDPADFIHVRDLKSFEVMNTWIDGQLVAGHGKAHRSSLSHANINRFEATEKQPSDFFVENRAGTVRVIDVIEGQLVTREFRWKPSAELKSLQSDLSQDVLKISVVERYGGNKMAVGFIRGFGLKRGAIASSVAHDCHNIVAVGTSDEQLCRAVNAVIRHRGGLAVVDGETENVLPLPVAGIMSDGEGHTVARQYATIDQLAKNLGSPLRAPFMTLSFMALLVIPSLKLSDRGLFDGEQFKFVDLFTQDNQS